MVYSQDEYFEHNGACMENHVFKKTAVDMVISDGLFCKNIFIPHFVI